MTEPRVDPHVLRRISVAAECDPRSVARVLAGEPVRPLIAMRVRRALRRLRIPEMQR